MDRTAGKFLESWIRNPSRKPLLIRGARQVGKSTLVRLFAKHSGLTLFEVDLERHGGLKQAFVRRDLANLLRELEFLLGQGPIAGEKALLFLDEIQAIPEAIACLRDFYEQKPALPVIAAGSLLELALADRRTSMPVGRIEFLYLEPMTYEEFLSALGEADLLALLRTYRFDAPFPDSAHDRLLDRLRDYLLVGGMPEAVSRFAEAGELSAAQAAHASLIETYRADFAKYATQAELRRLQKVFDHVPRSVGDKFRHSRVDPGEQSRDLRRALDLLSMARVVRPVFHSEGTGLPLGASLDDKIIKPYFLDVGLVSASCGIRWIPDAELHAARFVNEGRLAEQFIAQHLPALGGSDRDIALTYWLREGRSHNAELDFLVQLGTDVVPVEVKAGKSGTLKSLLQFIRQHDCKRAVRFDLSPPRRDPIEHAPTTGGPPLRFELLSLPLYMVEQLPRLWPR